MLKLTLKTNKIFRLVGGRHRPLCAALPRRPLRIRAVFFWGSRGDGEGGPYVCCPWHRHRPFATALSPPAPHTSPSGCDRNQADPVTRSRQAASSSGDRKSVV